MSTVSEMANPNWRTYFGYVWMIFGWVGFHRQHRVESRFHHATRPENLISPGMPGASCPAQLLSQGGARGFTLW